MLNGLVSFLYATMLKSTYHVYSRAVHESMLFVLVLHPTVWTCVGGPRVQVVGDWQLSGS